MNTFLGKISRLESIQEVILLSNQREPLFFHQKKSTTESKEILFSYWNTIITSLSQPRTAEFAFTNGSYYLTRTNIGYLILGLHDDKALAKIKQACNTIHTKLSSPSLCKRVLLNLLSQSDDKLKQHIIKELAPHADAEVAAVLIFLLQKEKSFSTEARKNLLLLICQTLGYCSSPEAKDALMDFLSKLQADTNSPDSQIIEAINLSIEQLEHNPTRAQQPVAKVSKSVKPAKEQSPPAVQKNKAVPRLNVPEQQKIERLLETGKQDEALQLMMQLIAHCAGKKQFDAADRLREWLIKSNPMALTDIIRAAELIDTAKEASINREHLETWKELTTILSSEEFSSLYHAMTLRTYAKGKVIVQQGSQARTLVFINKGHVQTQAQSREMVVPLSLRGAGEIIGSGTFFEASVWTMSALSRGCELFLLSRTKFNSLKESFPSIEPKLSDYCSKTQSTDNNLKKSGKNRRQFERLKTSGKIGFVVLDKNGQTISNEVKGDLIDISSGGLAFSIHSSRKKNAAHLFGRQLRININTGISSQLLVRLGTVQAVRDIDLIGNEYSLHLEFDKQLTQLELQQIVHR